RHAVDVVDESFDVRTEHREVVSERPFAKPLLQRPALVARLGEPRRHDHDGADPVRRTLVDHPDDDAGGNDEDDEVEVPPADHNRPHARDAPDGVVPGVDRVQGARVADVAERTLDLRRPGIRRLRRPDDRDRPRSEQRPEPPSRCHPPSPRNLASRHAIAAFSPRSWVIRRNSSRAGRFAVSIITSSSVFAAIAVRNPATSQTRFAARLVAWTTKGSFFAISWASSSVASSSRSRGTTRFTNPSRSASSAGTRSSPVNRSSFAARIPTTHGRNIETTPEPKRTSTYPKYASSTATARSQASMRPVPPARQQDSTDAITGLGQSRIS